MGLEYYENLLNETKLKDNLIISSIFITVFEHVKESMIENVKSFLNDFKFENGDFFEIESLQYKELRKRKIKEIGKPNVFFSTLLWLVDEGCLNDTDYMIMSTARDIRNNYAHNLFNVLGIGVTDRDIEMLIKMLAVYSKFDTWWIVHIEIPISGEYTQEDYENINTSNCFSLQQYFINAIIDIVLMDKNKDNYQEFLKELHNASKNYS